MKVSELLAHLGSFDPDEELCALIYTKRLFAHHTDDEAVLTDEGWAQVCGDFAHRDFDDVWEAVDDLCANYAEER